MATRKGTRRRPPPDGPLRSLSTRARATGALVLAVGIALAAYAVLAGPLGRGPAPAAASVRLRADDLVFSGLVGTATPARPLVLHNDGATAQTVTSIDLTGTVDAFRIQSDRLPATIGPGHSLAVPVVFDPPATAQGSVAATALVGIAGSSTPSAVVELRGLASRSEFDEGEPALATIVRTLGYRIDVGGAGLALGTAPTPIGEEVAAQTFVRSGPGPVRVRSVARYSPTGPQRIAYRTGTGPEVVVATVRSDASQTLLPALVDGRSSASFQPGGQPFGLVVTRTGSAGATTATSTEDAANPPATPHRARTYPVHVGSAVAALPHTWLIGIEESENGDYQDTVLLVTGADPAPRLAG